MSASVCYCTVCVCDCVCVRPRTLPWNYTPKAIRYVLPVLGMASCLYEMTTKRRVPKTAELNTARIVYSEAAWAPILERI